MSRLSRAFDTHDETGKPVHSKVLTLLVTVADIIMVGFSLIDSEWEAFVMIALTGAVYGHDWGKSFVKTKFGNGNGNGSPPNGTSHNGVA